MSQSFEVSRTSVGTDFLSTGSHHVMYSGSDWVRCQTLH